jgi:integrase
MRARLKKRFPCAHRGRKRWVWVVRYTATDGTDQGDCIGYWTSDSRDPWQPRPYRGRTLPRLSETQARDLLRKFDERIEQGRQDKPQRTEWDQFAEDFVDRTRGTIRDTSLEILETTLRIFAELCEPGSPRAVDQRMAKRFVQLARESGRREATVNRFLGGLRRVWNSEFPNNPNPFRATRSERQGGIRRFKVPDREWHRTTPEELGKLLRVCDSYWQAMILLAYTAGLREGEIWNLTWADVDLDGMTIAVNTKQDTANTWSWSPKDHQRRTLPLTPRTKAALLRLERTDDQPYVVVTRERYARIWREFRQGKRPARILNNFLTMYHTRCRWAGVSEDDFHALRKTAITNWLEAGMPPHEVQNMAGHSSIETTIRFYAKVDRSAIDRARAASIAYTREVGDAG